MRRYIILAIVAAFIGGGLVHISDRDDLARLKRYASELDVLCGEIAGHQRTVRYALAEPLLRDRRLDRMREEQPYWKPWGIYSCAGPDFTFGNYTTCLREGDVPCLIEISDRLVRAIDERRTSRATHRPWRR